MNRAIISYAEGEEHLKLAAMTWPLMEAYANRIGAEWHPYTEVPVVNRPPAWKKLVCMSHALSVFDEVLWLDADVVVADTADIFAGIPTDMSHALVEHHTDEGDVPNTGVWICRRPMIPWITVAAMNDACVEHKWWEQAAILHLLGYEMVHGRCMRTSDTELLRKTHWLDERWNYCYFSKGEPASFIHPCGSVGEARLECVRNFLEPGNA